MCSLFYSQVIVNHMCSHYTLNVNYHDWTDHNIVWDMNCIFPFPMTQQNCRIFLWKHRSVQKYVSEFINTLEKVGAGSEVAYKEHFLLWYLFLAATMLLRFEKGLLNCRALDRSVFHSLKSLFDLPNLCYRYSKESSQWDDSFKYL